MALESVFIAVIWGAAMWAGCHGVAFWAAVVSLAMYAINVGIMDLPWALRYRCAVGDTSGLWQIAPVPAVLFSAVMVIGRALMVVVSAEPNAALDPAAMLAFQSSSLSTPAGQVSWVVPEARFGRIGRSIGEPSCARRCRRTDARIAARESGTAPRPSIRAAAATSDNGTYVST